PGISGRLFGKLGKAGISIRMITQGSEELDIIVGVKESDFDEAIKVIYDAFIDSDKNIISIDELDAREGKFDD
ncbi:MAG: ACT domain-containing protein, partial [Eggerthellaceae bacterium]|nr:ACT domain-containing protein [Eggerthellaceae bacterium]